MYELSLTLVPVLLLAALAYAKRCRRLGITPPRHTLIHFIGFLEKLSRAPENVREVSTELTLRVLTWMIRRTHRDTMSMVRDGFRMLLLPVCSSSKSTNAHPLAAAHRSAATAMIQHLCALIGKSPYYYQQSVTDQRRGRDGHRDWLWAKDVAVDRRDDGLTESSVIAMVDVDFYVDMPKFLLAHPDNIVVLYTITPQAVAGRSLEAAFSFTASNEVEWHLAGSGCYKHPLWDWNVDIIRVDGWARSVIYQVEKLDLGEHRSLVALIPQSSWSWPSNYFARTLEAQPLRRMTVNTGKHSRLRIIRSDDVVVSTGLVGALTETTVTEQVDNAIAVAARVSKTELSIHAVATWISEDARNGLMVDATNLVEYHREAAKNARTVGQTVYPAHSAVRGYEANFGNLDSKPSMVAFATPMIHESFSPNNCYHNEAWAVRARVIDLQKTDAPKPLPKDIGYMEDFVKLMVPVPYIGHPTDDDEVAERQARPSQQALRAQASGEAYGKRKVSSFLKKESGRAPKDPRVISTINVHDKSEYSKFTYSMADHVVTHCTWYAFSRSPADIAQRVADLCKRAAFYVLLTDFSRMDGRVGEMMRQLERMFALRFFAPEHHARIAHLLSTQHHIRASTTHGVRYDSLWARLSGSPETALFNTVVNAFIAYAALRDCGMSSQEAWDALGLYGGDDGLTADVDTDKYENAAKRYGQLLEINKVKRGENAVDFLARWYGPYVWHGDPNSCSDIPRALSKFHVTVSMPESLTAEQKFFEKALSLSFTDAQTPGLALLVKRAKSVRPTLIDTCEGVLLGYNAVVAVNERYPNVEAPWMTDRLQREAPGLNLDPLILWSEGVYSLLELPLLMEPKPAPPGKTSIVESGDLVPAVGQSTDQAVKQGKRREAANPATAAHKAFGAPVDQKGKERLPKVGIPTGGIPKPPAYLPTRKVLVRPRKTGPPKAAEKK